MRQLPIPQLILYNNGLSSHIDVQYHISCFVIYMLQPAHMLNKDIRSLI
jgi:hypothetical protein